MNDEFYMRKALVLARRGLGFTSPNPMVGAIVVHGGEIVGQGFHPRAGQPHAEVFAIDEAGEKARGATIFVTLEPCNHTGRTPPCTQKILNAGIDRVVVAMKDPNPDVAGGGLEYLENAGLAVTSGVLEKEAQKLNEIFVKYITTQLPFVLVKCAATLDGQLATRTGDSRWVTGSAAREYVHRLRHAYDGILVGAETVRKDDPSLTARLADMETCDPHRIILDPNLTVPVNAKLIRQKSDADTFLVTSDTISDSRLAKMKDAGVRILAVPLKNGRIPMRPLMKVLAGRGITSVLIEGGGKVIRSAFQAGIVDKINFFYAPKILGGNDGTAICSGSGPDRMIDAVDITDVRFERFGHDLLVAGYPRI